MSGRLVFSGRNTSSDLVLNENVRREGIDTLRTSGMNDASDSDNHVTFVVSPSPSPPPHVMSTIRVEAQTTTNSPSSDFDISRMPCNEIHRRILYPFSIHPAAGGWIATLSRPGVDPSNSNRIKHMQFTLPTEREARKFCKAYSPPQLCTNGDQCMSCRSKVPVRRNCRNCGIIVCESCTRQWGSRMVPRSFHSFVSHNNAFCMALLQGRYQDGVTLYETVSSV